MLLTILIHLLLSSPFAFGQKVDARMLPGHSLRLLYDGKSLTEARLSLIDGAVNTIYLATFELNRDSSSLEIAKHLCDKAHEGVDVRLLLDGRGSRHFKRHVKQLRDCGARVLFYHPLDWGLAEFRRVLHEKLLAVDGKVAILGGSNYANSYDEAGPESTHWHDLDVRIAGPAACWFHYRFEREWKRVAWMDIRPERRWYSGELLERIIGRRYGLQSFRSCEFVDGGGQARVYPIQQDPYFDPGNWLLHTHLRLINASRHRIRLYAPYFTPHEK
ncbi:MAG: hypothetical protein HY074_20160, partial [Deltaproteobacteria bacterium]|nr:hypothetical protein [Deltaproteobacteria bacterium]